MARIGVSDLYARLHYFRLGSLHLQTDQRPELKFPIYLLVFTFFLGGLLALFHSVADWYSNMNLIWATLAFFMVLSAGSYYYALAAREASNNRFVGRFLAVTGFRIILSAIFLAIYLIISAERDQVFVLTFMCLYLFFTIFEIYHLVTKLRPENKSEVESTSH